MFCQSQHYIFSTFKPKLSHRLWVFGEDNWWMVNQRSPWDFVVVSNLHWLSSQLSVKRCQFRWRQWGSSLTLFQLYIVTQQYLNKTHGVFVCNMSSFLCAQANPKLQFQLGWVSFNFISPHPTHIHMLYKDGWDFVIFNRRTGCSSITVVWEVFKNLFLKYWLQGRLGVSVAGKVGSHGWVPRLGSKAGSQGWVPRLGPKVGSHGLVPWLGPMVGSNGWVPRLGPKVAASES